VGKVGLPIYAPDGRRQMNFTCKKKTSLLTCYSIYVVRKPHTHVFSPTPTTSADVGLSDVCDVGVLDVRRCIHRGIGGDVAMERDGGRRGLLCCWVGWFDVQCIPHLASIVLPRVASVVFPVSRSSCSSCRVYRASAPRAPPQAAVHHIVRSSRVCRVHHILALLSDRRPSYRHHHVVIEHAVPGNGKYGGQVAGSRKWGHSLKLGDGLEGVGDE
jgi:hypothetical protein